MAQSEPFDYKSLKQMKADSIISQLAINLQNQSASYSTFRDMNYFLPFWSRGGDSHKKWSSQLAYGFS